MKQVDRLLAKQISSRRNKNSNRNPRLHCELLESRTLLASSAAPVIPTIPPQIPSPPKPFDLEMVSATATGDRSLEVKYHILNPLPPSVGTLLSFQFYRSSDAAFDSSDSLMDSVTVCVLQGCSDLISGSHTRTFTIGTGPGEVKLPGVGVPETDEDYHILAVAQWSHDQFTANNTAVLEGVYSDGNLIRTTIYVHGSASADTVQISANPATIQNSIVDLNGTRHEFSPRPLIKFRVRSHGGNDQVTGSGIAVWGGSGNDLIIGGGRADIFRGGSGDDVLKGGGGFDLLEGEAGNDLLDSGSGNDQLNGGAGNDIFFVSGAGFKSIRDASGIDTLDVSSLAEAVVLDLDETQVQSITVSGDTLEIEASVENVIGTAFDDTILGNDSDNHIVGAAGSDILDGRDGTDKLEGGEGDDLLVAGSGNDSLDGAAGNDTFVINTSESVSIRDSSGVDTLDFSGSPEPLKIRLGLDAGQPQSRGASGSTLSLIGTFENLLGTDFDDVLTGNSSDNLIDGGAGGDIIRGGPGQDSLEGNDGADRLFGNLGDDGISGGEGNDILVGGRGDDIIFGGSDNDRLIGQAGADQLEGNDGSDILFGGAQNDSLHGGNGNDRLVGHSGADELDGGVGNDVLLGGSGFDVLFGGDGVDRLSGQRGNDQLEGGSGNDRIFGGSGADLMLGQKGNDRLVGQGGEDSMFGGQGRDIISGGPGDDLLFGGPFFTGDTSTVDDVIADVLRGGSGRDRAFRSVSRDRFGSDIEEIL